MTAPASERKKEGKVVAAATRPFETDYAGAWRGHAGTREGAILAAMRHVVRDGYARCTVTDKRTGEVVARVVVSGDRKRATVELPRPFKPGWRAVK